MPRFILMNDYRVEVHALQGLPEPEYEAIREVLLAARLPGRTASGGSESRPALPGAGEGQGPGHALTQSLSVQRSAYLCSLPIPTQTLIQKGDLMATLFEALASRVRGAALGRCRPGPGGGVSGTPCTKEGGAFKASRWI